MPSKRIAGITIEIGGDTTKLNSALKSVDKQLSTTQNTLRDVNKLLKLDPGNVELLTQKQKGLESSIKTTKDRLKELRSAQGSVPEGTKEWDDLQREIAATEQDLKSLEKEYKNFGSVSAQQVKAAGEKIEGVGSGVKKVGDTLTKGLTTPIVAGFGAAIKVTANFDAEMQKVSAISGATGNDFDMLRDKAREMGEKTKFSATEAGQAMEYMAMAGWKTNDMIDGIDGIMSLAAASGEDLATTSDIVTDALTAMGYKAEDAGRLADVMAAASSNANTNVAMMGETFKYAAAVGGSYGYTMEDIALATGLMANSGIKASQAGTSLRSIMTRLATDAGASNKSLGALGTLTEKLGVSFYEADGSMRSFRDVINDSRKAWKSLTAEEQANYAKKIAGQNAITGWLALMNSSTEDVNKLSSAIDNSTGTAQEMSDVMQNSLSGQVEILKSQLAELAISAGDTLIPMARSAVSVIQEIVDGFNKLDPETKNLVVKVGLVVAAVGPLLSMGGRLLIGIGQLMTFAPGLVAAFGAVGGAILPIIAIVGGAVAAGVILYKNWDKISAYAKKVKTNVQQAWTQLKTTVITNATNMKTGAMNAWNTMKTGVTTVANNLKTSVTTAVTGAKDSAIEKWETLKSRTSEIYESMRETASSKVDDIKQKLVSGFDSASDGVRSAVNDMKNDLKDKLSDAKDAVKNFVSKAKSAFKFKWKLPNIKLPHFDIDGGEAPYGLGGQGKLPSFSIEWYRKAYDQPYLFTSPTITAGPGSLRGFGDAGSRNGGEMVYSRDALMRDIARATSGEITINVYAQPGMDVNQLADRVQSRLAQLQKQREAAYA